MLDFAQAMTSVLTEEGAVTTDRVTAIGASQLELEALYVKSQLMPTLREDFASDFMSELEAAPFPAMFGLDLLAQMHLHKRATPDTLVGMLKHHFYDQPNPAQACADALEQAAAMDLVDAEFVLKFDEAGEQYETIELVLRYEASRVTQERIDRFQYPLPMIEEPQKVCFNNDTGYRTLRNSIILRKNHHDDDVCLDHINRVNRQRLAINPSVVAFIQNAWRNLDKRNPGESYVEFRARKKAFLKYDQTSRDVIDALLVHGDAFWLTHKYDKRGRTYSQGYHVNYQGNDWNKACIEFADKEPLNEA